MRGLLATVIGLGVISCAPPAPSPVQPTAALAPAPLRAPRGAADASPSNARPAPPADPAHVDPPTLVWEWRGKRHVAPQSELRTADGSAIGTASGKPLFVGYGITEADRDWVDYGADVNGHILVVLDGAPVHDVCEYGIEYGKHVPDPPKDTLRSFGSMRYKIQNARAHGAAGVIIVAGDQLPATPTDPSQLGIPAIVVSRSVAHALFPSLGFEDDEPSGHQRPPPGTPAPPAPNRVTITTFPPTNAGR